MKLQLAKGVKDIPPEEKLLQNQIITTLKKYFELYGYAPLDTPIIERLDVLSSKYSGGAEILKETYKIKDQGNRDLALRYDLTVPFARYIGMNPTLKMPFKRYQIGEVFRDGPIKLGRYRQFTQCDIDVVGSSKMETEAEIFELVASFFKELKLEIIVRVNNRKVLDGMMNYAGVKEIDSAILSIDKLKKIGEQGVKKELEEKKIKKDSIKKIFEILECQNLKELKKYLPDNEGIRELENLFSLTNKATLDITLARGLAYYTGTIFEVFLIDSKIKSSVAAGGRYDNMIGKFLNSEKKYPAVGIAFGLSVIMDSIKLKQKITKQTPTKVFIIPLKTDKESFKLAQLLRSKGINTDFDLVGKSISKNLDYASKKGIPYTLIVGQKELESKKFTLRDMETGKEQKLTKEALINRLQ